MATARWVRAETRSVPAPLLPLFTQMLISGAALAGSPVRVRAVVSASWVAPSISDGAAFSKLSESTNASEPRNDSPRPPGAFTRAAAQPAQPAQPGADAPAVLRATPAAPTRKPRVLARKTTVGQRPWRNSTVAVLAGGRHITNIKPNEVPEDRAGMSAASVSPKLVSALGALDSTTCSPTTAPPATAVTDAPRKRSRLELSPSMPDTLREAIRGYPEYLSFVDDVPRWYADATAFARVNYDKKKFFDYTRTPAKFRLEHCIHDWIEFERIFAAGVDGWDRDSNATAEDINSFRAVPVVDGAAVAPCVSIVNSYIAYLAAREEHYRRTILCSSQEGSE